MILELNYIKSINEIASSFTKRFISDNILAINV